MVNEIPSSEILDGVWKITNESDGSNRVVKLETVTDGDLKDKRIIYLKNATDSIWDFAGVAFLETTEHEVEELYPEEEEYTEEVDSTKEVDYSGTHDDCLFSFYHTHDEPVKLTVSMPRTVTKTRMVKIPQNEVVIWKRLKGTQEHKIIEAWYKIITVGIQGTRFEFEPAEVKNATDETQ